MEEQIISNNINNRLDELDELDELDTGWIQKYEFEEKDYEKFYKESVDNIKVNYLYINNQNELHKIKKENIILNNKNILTRDILIDLIKENQNDNQNKYKIQSIIKYNITLNPENIIYFIDEEFENKFTEQIENIDDIKFEPSINIFQDLNSIYLIYKEVIKTEINKKLNRIGTKKIYLNTKQRKTKKRNLKI